MSNDLRYEIKLVADAHNISLFENWIKYYVGCKKKYPDRWVNSIYFDDQMDRSILDNLNGNNERVKVRLRWYGNIDQEIVSFPKLEYKIKKGKLSKKESLLLPDLKNNLVSFNQSRLRKHIFEKCMNDSFNHQFLKNYYFSKLMTSYRRKYFENSSALRITIDDKIDFRKLFLNKSIKESKKLPYSKKIIELKFSPDKKNYVSKLLKETSLNPTRHSKYLVGLAKFKELIYV